MPKKFEYIKEVGEKSKQTLLVDFNLAPLI